VIGAHWGEIMNLRLIAAVAACLLLCACASQPVIPFDKSTAGEIKTIGIVTNNMPEKPSVWLVNDLGKNFGLIGALIDAGLQNSRENKFWVEIDGAKNPPTAIFNTALAEALTAEGYALKPVEVKKRPNDFLKTYPKTDGVDAYLDLTFMGTGYGYLAADMADATPYRPYAYVNCRLVRASDNAVLMQDTVVYNYVSPTGASLTNGVTISPDPAYNFVDFDAMQADPPKVTKGLHETLKTVAKSVANLIQ
jgi:hypothetical protein